MKGVVQTVWASLMIAAISFGQVEEILPDPLPEEIEEEEEIESLPAWTVEEKKMIESGELIPGSALIGAIALEVLFSDTHEPIVFETSIDDLPDLENSDGDQSVTIEAQFLEDYFRRPPEALLVDPQELLSAREFEDQSGYLDYRAKQNQVAIFLYLFDGAQELPQGESPKRVIREHFEPEEESVVVFYFHGNPEKTQIAVTDAVSRMASRGRLIRIHKLAIKACGESSGPQSQLEDFTVELSDQFLRIERGTGQDLAGGAFGHGGNRNSAGGWGLNSLVVWSTQKPFLFYTVTSLLIFIVTASIWYGLRWGMASRRSFVFPDAEGAPLLEAPHAAGVGGVISFSSVTKPPSLQKEEVPDYLRRL